MARGGLTNSDFNTPGCKPGSPRAISQHKAISEGYMAAKSPRMVMTRQAEATTGRTMAPGLTNGSGRKG